MFHGRQRRPRTAEYGWSGAYVWMLVLHEGRISTLLLGPDRLARCKARVTRPSLPMANDPLELRHPGSMDGCGLCSTLRKSWTFHV